MLSRGVHGLFEQHYRLCHYSTPIAYEAEPFGGGSFHADAFYGGLQAVGQGRAHLLYVGLYFRPL